MVDETALVIYAGGIREITMVMGAFAVPGFRDICMRCSTVLGTSAGALMGFIIACCSDAVSLGEVRTNVESICPHPTWWDILWKFIRGKDVITRGKMQDMLYAALNVIQPNRDTENVELYRKLVVGYVLHTSNVPNGDGRVRAVYQEHVFEPGPHKLQKILSIVISSAAIIGLTEVLTDVLTSAKEKVSDGAQMHSFPVNYYVDKIRKEKHKVFMISPYPMREMMYPVADDDASRLVQMFYSVFYASQMSRANDDLRRVLVNPVMYDSNDEAEVYVDYQNNVFAALPKKFYAASRLVSVTETQKQKLLRVGRCMGEIMSAAAGEFKIVRDTRGGTHFKSVTILF